MEFSVVINVAEEGSHQLKLALESIRRHYKETVVPVHVISDGVANAKYGEIAGIYGAQYTADRYLKRIECGGMWWRRTLKIGSSYHKQWILKMDPDARFTRRFYTEPRYALSGTVLNAGTPFEHVQGGCQAISIELADRLISSGLLERNELRQQWRFCPSSEWLKAWYPTGYLSTDYSLMFLLKKVGADFGPWSEIRSLWSSPPPGNVGKKYAVIHPFRLKSHNVGVSDDCQLHIVTTCKGRLHHLKQSLPSWLKEDGVDVTVVDYSCPDGAGEWVTRHYPAVRVVSVEGKDIFHLAHARNVGAAATPAGWLCFLDADLVVKSGWARAVRKALMPGHYHVASPLQWGMTGSCIVHSDDYLRAGGYDETFHGWACEDIDFYTCLRQTGTRPAFWPGQFAEAIPHSDRERVAYYTQGKQDSKKRYEAYYHRKVEFMISQWRLPTLAERRNLLAQCVEGEGYDALLV
jgi:hypothetical protein